MKQGSTPTVQAGHKREPIAHKAGVEAVSQLGQAITWNRRELYPGKGYEAPKPMAEDHHHCGSQGKH